MTEQRLERAIRAWLESAAPWLPMVLKMCHSDTVRAA